MAKLIRFFRPLVLSAITLLPTLQGISASEHVVSEASAKAVATETPAPEYPVEARRSLWWGRGVARLEIDTSTGRVTRTWMERSTGHPVLDKAALDAFGRWRFRPGTVSRVRVPIRFDFRDAFDPRRAYPFRGIVRFIDSRYAGLRVQGEHVTDTVKVMPGTQITRNGKPAPFSEIRLLDHVEGRGILNPPEYRVYARSLIVTSPDGR